GSFVHQLSAFWNADIRHRDASPNTCTSSMVGETHRNSPLPSAPRPRNEAASSSGFFTRVRATQSRADTCKQLIRINWLAQIADDAASEGTDPETVIGIRGNNDCRNGVSGLDQPTVQ